MEGISIAIAALVTILALLAEHYFPWQRLAGRPLHPIHNYILGVLALLLPYSGLLLVWDASMQDIPAHLALGALWIITLAGGASVAASYFLDSWLAHRSGHLEGAERENAWRVGIMKGEDRR